MKKWTNTRSDGPGEVIAFTSTYDWGTYFRVSFDGSYADAEEDSRNWGMSINKYIAIAKKHNATVEKYIRIVINQTTTDVRFKNSDDANDFLEELRRKMHTTKLMNTE